MVLPPVVMEVKNKNKKHVNASFIKTWYLLLSYTFNLYTFWKIHYFLLFQGHGEPNTGSTPQSFKGVGPVSPDEGAKNFGNGENHETFVQQLQQLV